MRANSPHPLIPILLYLGGAVFGILGTLHAVYTLLDLQEPRRLVPVDPSVLRSMQNSALRLSGGGTDMWRAWIGFNFSHSLGLLLVCALAVWVGTQAKALPTGVLLPALTLIGSLYLILCLRYWFRAPAIGVAIGTACFAAAWILSLR
jgi:hypothetical protein